MDLQGRFDARPPDGVADDSDQSFHLGRSKERGRPSAEVHRVGCEVELLTCGAEFDLEGIEILRYERRGPLHHVEAAERADRGAERYVHVEVTDRTDEVP